MWQIGTEVCIFAGPYLTEEMETRKGRFAPSPSGRMHLGNMFCALLSWLSAKSRGGKWLLRIEDLDPGRSRYEYARLIEDDLHWLGLDWDEGGIDADGGSYCQSRRGDIYERELGRLMQTGLVYPCRCTRADIMATQAPHLSDGHIVYSGKCRPAGIEDAGREGHTSYIYDWKGGKRAAAARIFVSGGDICFDDGHYGPQCIDPSRLCGDFVLRRADNAWAYQFAVVVDDALMGVDEVVRGRDLLASAAQQIYLYRLLGYREPAFAHLPLLCNEKGERLCKRDRSLDMGELRKTHSAEEITGLLSCLAGLTEKAEACSPASLVSLFDWKKVPLGDIRISPGTLPEL